MSKIVGAVQPELHPKVGHPIQPIKVQFSYEQIYRRLQIPSRYALLPHSKPAAHRRRISNVPHHLRRWIAAYEHGGLAALEHPQAMADKKTNPFIADKPDKEKTQDELLQEVGYLRAEVAYLKKARSPFSSEDSNAKKAQIIEALRANHPLKYLLPAAKMERSSFYFSRKHNQKPDKDLADMQTVRAVYDQHKGRYGARRIAAALSWNKKKAERLMKKMNLKAIVREKRKYYPPAMGEVSENLLNRNFSAEAR